MSFLLRFLAGTLMCQVASAQINASFFPFKDTYHIRGILSDIAILNLTQDSKLDILVADFANDNVSFFYNEGSCPNMFSRGVFIQAVPSGDGPVALDTSDFNRDGITDFVILNALSKDVWVYENRRKLPIIGAPILRGTYSVGNMPNALIAEDIDGDGKADLVISHEDGSLHVLRNTSTSSVIQFEQALVLATSISLTSLCSGDLDGDGKVDLILGGRSGNGLLSLLKNNSNPGTISFHARIDQTINLSPSVVKLADIDADGKKDILAAGLNDNRLLILHNETATDLFFTAPIYIQMSGIIKDIQATDLNNDQQLDVLTLHPTTDSMGILTHVGTGTIWDETIFLPAVNLYAGDDPIALHISDLNEDGRNDILNTNREFRNFIIQYGKNNNCSGTDLPIAADYYIRYNPDQFVLTASGSGTLTWYKDSSLYHIIGSGGQYNTPYLEYTDTFYVTNSTSCCESKPIEVIVVIECSILPPTATSAYRCGAGIISLQASSADSIYWYKHYAKDTAALTRGPVFNTSYLEKSDTFYVAASRNGCRSQRLKVVASIFPIMEARAIEAETGICSSNGMHVYVPVSQNGVNYYLIENQNTHTYIGNGNFLSLGHYPIGTSVQVSSDTPCDSMSLNIQYQDSRIPVIPNLITINGDGMNDHFSIQNLPIESRVSIYNSWGSTVFSSDAYQNNWGNEEKSGVYFYELQYELCGKMEQQSGWLQVVNSK